jgi:hypothetical protein
MLGKSVQTFPVEKQESRRCIARIQLSVPSVSTLRTGYETNHTLQIGFPVAPASVSLSHPLKLTGNALFSPPLWEVKVSIRYILALLGNSPNLSMASLIDNRSPFVSNILLYFEPPAPSQVLYPGIASGILLCALSFAYHKRKSRYTLVTKYRCLTTGSHKQNSPPQTLHPSSSRT